MTAGIKMFGRKFVKFGDKTRNVEKAICTGWATWGLMKSGNIATNYRELFKSHYHNPGSNVRDAVATAMKRLGVLSDEDRKKHETDREQYELMHSRGWMSEQIIEYVPKVGLQLSARQKEFLTDTIAKSKEAKRA